MRPEGSSTSSTDVPQDFSTLAGERSPTNNDIKNMASMSGIWDLSYYHGPNRWVGGVLNGWEISPIVTLNSGTPITVQHDNGSAIFDMKESRFAEAELLFGFAGK